MAVKDGLPATDLSKMNREYVKNLRDGETVPDGLPATDLSRMNREWIKAVVAEGGGSQPTGTITITENGEYDVTDYATADVQVAGGSSDFSMAEVTLALTPPEGVTLTSWLIINASFNTEDIVWYPSDTLTAETNKIKLPMAKNGNGVVCGYFEDISGADAEYNEYYLSAAPVLSGGISYDSESNLYTVTGDCTITGTVALFAG